ncbi:branched-chain amino acid ABC transporter permease [Halomicrococcus sp. SG-WS-1]|uniref:branched-chain amino acid ABC transporter permease n=1 Tax=Halomicrococcus sp. SG-WS-1 TaxID=3439057 RepID=UPI003F7AA3CE
MTSQPLVQNIGDSRLKQAIAVIGLLSIVVLVVSPYIGLFQPSFLFYLMFWVAMTVSVHLVFGLTGYIPFGYFAFYGIGSYVTAMAYIHLNLHMIGAVFAGGIASIILGVLFLPLFRLDGIYFAIATFAAAWAIRIGITLTPESITGGATGLYISEAYNPALAYYAMVVVTLTVVATTVWLLRSRYGTILRAIRDDATAAEMSGINRARMRSYVWLLSVFFPGLLGGIDTWNTTVVSPEGSFDVLLSVKPILYALFGGVGTVVGPIIGSTSLYLLDDFIWSALPFGSYLVTGLVLMLVVLVFPRGLLGEFEYREDLFGEDGALRFDGSTSKGGND